MVLSVNECEPPAVIVALGVAQLLVVLHASNDDGGDDIEALGERFNLAQVESTEATVVRRRNERSSSESIGFLF